MGVKEAKRALRRRIKGWRDGLDPGEREAWSKRIAARVLALDCYLDARTVMVYASFGSEVATVELGRAVLGAAKRLVMPRVVEKGLTLRAVADPATELTAGVWGILEPAMDLPPVPPGEVELFLLPGLAFDAAGGRLGYGRGYFDRVLAGVRGAKVALAFDGQVVEAVPCGPADVPMDLLVTPTRVIRCGGGKSETGA